MPSDGGFLVEEFLGAIATQLDRTQDDLALKAVNRPLTYAIKDFSMELKVFVEMDAQGRVRFRTPAANESGASSVSIGFTTITRPMIQENTIEVGLARSPTLSEAGLSEPEQRRLEQLGVRTTAELKRLESSTGTAGISRVADIPLSRLRAALAFGRPAVSTVRPAPAPPPPKAPPSRPPSQTPTPVPPLVSQAPPPRPPATQPPATPPTRPPATPPTTRPPASSTPAPAPTPRPPAPAPRPRPPEASPVPPRPQPRPAPQPPSKPGIAPIPPETRRIELVGRNMLGPRGAPQLRLGGRPLAIAEAEEDRIVAELPDDLVAAGTLEVDDGEGQVITYELPRDPWAPVDHGTA